jgi:hypothetical protein
MSADERTVFVSYSRADAEFALGLARDLRSAGLPVWIDQLDIPPGARWDDAIERALRASNTIVSVVSASSVASPNVMDEVSFALETGKRVVPVRLGACEIPFRMRRLQYVDFAAERGLALRSLIEALKGADSRAPDVPTVRQPVAATPSARPAGRSGRTATLIGLAVAALTVAAGAVLWRSGLWTSVPDPTFVGSQAADGECAAIIRSGVRLTATHRGPRLTVGGFLLLSEVKTDGDRGEFVGTMSFAGQIGVEAVRGEWTGAAFRLLRPDAEMQIWEGRCDRHGRIGGRWSWAHRPDDNGPFTIEP